MAGQGLIVMYLPVHTWYSSAPFIHGVLSTQADNFIKSTQITLYWELTLVHVKSASKLWTYIKQPLGQRTFLLVTRWAYPQHNFKIEGAGQAPRVPHPLSTPTCITGDVIYSGTCKLSVCICAF